MSMINRGRTRKIEAVIFDIDGTMIDTDVAYSESLRASLTEHNIRIPTDLEIKRIRSLPAREALKTIGVIDFDAVLKTWSKIFNDLSLESSFYEGVIETIEKLNKMGVVIAIVSSRDKNAMKPILNNPNIHNNVVLCVSAEDTEKHKPDPDPILFALETLKVKPKKSIYVGDAIEDYLSATRANVMFVAAGWNTKTVTLPGVRITHPMNLIELCCGN